MIKLRNNRIDLAFEFEIVDYQFPEIKNDKWDSNWCLVKAIVSQGNNCFEKTDPALTTFNLIEIQDWFTSLSENKLPDRADLHFMEPCIAFRFLGRNEDGVRIIIELSCELQPPFRLSDYLCHERNYLGEYEQQEETEGWDMVFTLSDGDFKQILKGLDKAIAKYPTR